ncbi:MAG: FAD-dependent oxidoreductase [bacterium]|nr:FAD-dependent oxidoreductase [bacterium]
MFEETLVETEKLKPKNGEYFDLLIIGAGPAGMSAALCAARAKLKVLIIEKALPGGDTASAYVVDNYLGFPGGIFGEKLASQMEKHMNEYNIFYTCEEVEDILNIHNPIKTIKTSLGYAYRAKTVIIAAGLKPTRLETDFEKRFVGRGISYYAKCDVANYQDQDVAVMGGGNCACYAADYLSGFVNKIYLIHRSDNIKAVRMLKEKVLNNPKIITMWDSRVVDAFGIDKLEKIKIVNINNDQYTWVDVKGVFVYTGRVPSKTVLSVDIMVDEAGFIITDEFMRTNIQGIYAAGDIRSKQIRQIPTAVSDGMIAAINAERNLFK